MDTDSGRGSEPNEPPKLANVSRLHLDDVEASDATTNEEWYETERLSGQITGRTLSDLPINRPAPTQNGAPVVLDWRHAESMPAPTALERLAHSLTRRNRRRRRGPRFAPQKPGAQTRRSEQLSNVVDEKVKHQAATLSFVVVVSSSVTLMPSLNFTPASTSVTSSWPLKRRQRSWAASKSL